MKRKLCFLTFIFFVFLQNINSFEEKDATIDKKDIVKPFFSVENESDFNVNHDISNNLPQFAGYSDKLNLEAGIKLHVTDFFEIAPMFGVKDLLWDIDNNGAFKFNETGLYAGSYFNFKPHEIVTISTWFGNMEKFESNSVLWAGMKTGIGIDFDIENAFIELEIKDGFDPVYQSGTDPKLRTLLSNSLEYSFNFNVFNFINEKINTGFFIEGKLDTNSFFDDTSYNSTVLDNEFYFGVKTNPVKYFEGYCAFALFNGASFDNQHSIVTGAKIFDLGLKVGANITYEWFGVELNYVPHLYTSIDDVKGGISHVFELHLIVNFEKK